MYDNLIEKIRCCVEQIRCGDCRYVKDCDGDRMMMSQAADAIEELIKGQKHLAEQVAKWQAEVVKGDCEAWLSEQDRPRWIPVTDRLPKINSDMYSDDLIVCMRRFDGEGYYYEKFAGYLTSSNIWYTYQHDNCSQVGVEQHMKHYRGTADVIVAWMPMPSLPEPPKDGE